MKISTQNYPTNFGTSYRRVLKSSYTLGDCYEASTYFYVHGLEWDKFFNQVVEKYKNIPKVNVFSLACSDGSEAYSIAMLLIAKLGLEGAKKYFPIIAVDFDKVITRNARKGFMNLSAEDEVRINKYTNNKLNQFFERTNESFISDKIGGTDNRVLLTKFKTKPILSDKVVFITEDVNSYVDKMPKGTNLTFCRNCWPYLWKTRNEFAQKLSDKLDDNSYLVIGDYDFLLCPMQVEDCYGFTQNPEFENVYQKGEKKYNSSQHAIFDRLGLKIK